MRVGKFSISTSLLIRAALKRGLDCTFLHEKVIQISDETISHYFKGTTLPANNSVASKLSCNKYFLRRLLKKEGLPVPKTISLRNPSAWQKVLSSSLQFPLVVKPVNASHANGASLNLKTPKELEQAVIRAFAYIKKHKKRARVLVEEYFPGDDLRFLVVGDEVVSVAKREPAYVVGDGHSTIRQLIKTFNDEWRSSIKYDRPLCPIPVDNEVARYLAKENVSLRTILGKGVRQQLRWNANVSTGGRSSNVSDKTHPRLKELAVQIAKMSHLKIGGVDILCKDLTSKDISKHNVSILEINDSPGFDIHHFPFTGAGQDVCTDILSYIFKKNVAPEKRTLAHIERILTNIEKAQVAEAV